MNTIAAILVILGFDLTGLTHPAEIIPYIFITVLAFGLLWCILALFRYILTQLFSGRLV